MHACSTAPVAPASATTLADIRAGRNRAANLAALSASQPKLAREAGSAEVPVVPMFGRDGSLTAFDAEGRWWADPPPLAARPRLAVRRAARQAGLWRGWCADPNGLRTWIVAVRHAGREVARVRADGHAPRLASRGATRTGVGHFAFDAGTIGLAAEARLEFAVVPEAEDARPAGVSPRAAGRSASADPRPGS